MKITEFNRHARKQIIIITILKALFDGLDTEKLKTKTRPCIISIYAQVNKIQKYLYGSGRLNLNRRTDDE